MRILIDTNIFIYREANNKIMANIQNFHALANQLGIQIVVHPRSRNEIEKDSNRKRREISLSKFETYPILKDVPDPKNDTTFYSLLGYSAKSTDYIDDNILYAVYRNAVHLLVTEDKKMLRKAEKLGIRNKVLSSGEAVSLLSSIKKENNIFTPPAVRHVEIHSLNLYDSFFDSLRSDYSNFNEWFEEKAKEGREGFVFHRDDGHIGALLIYKHEEEALFCTPPQPKKRRLKLCLFKVDEKGFKIGELFIKIAVNLAIKNNSEEIYLTHYVKDRDPLVELISEYGFEEKAKTRDGEVVYIKEMFPPKGTIKNLPPIDISTRYWPYYYDGKEVRKFIVPIRPEYHERLFIELRKEFTLFESQGEFIVEGNTIKKAYLSKTKSKKFAKGDILLFYRTKDGKYRREESGITTIAVVDDVHHEVQNIDEALWITKNRTVYEKSEINNLLPVTIILFTWHFYLKKVIDLNRLLKQGFLKGPPQSITEISEKAYLFIKKYGGIDERYTVS